MGVAYAHRLDEAKPPVERLRAWIVASDLKLDFRTGARRFADHQAERRAAHAGALRFGHDHEVHDPPCRRASIEAQPPDRHAADEDHPPLDRGMMRGDVAFLKVVLGIAEPGERIFGPGDGREQRPPVLDMGATDDRLVRRFLLSEDQRACSPTLIGADHRQSKSGYSPSSATQ